VTVGCRRLQRRLRTVASAGKARAGYYYSAPNPAARACEWNVTHQGPLTDLTSAPQGEVQLRRSPTGKCRLPFWVDLIIKSAFRKKRPLRRRLPVVSTVLDSDSAIRKGGRVPLGRGCSIVKLLSGATVTVIMMAQTTIIMVTIFGAIR
jgi:hypothetical protein